MQDRYFEDFQPGDRFETGGITLTESQILDFALVYDPQPFHIDKPAAERSLFGGLAASGFQTMALTFRLFADTGVLRAANLGGSGGTDLRWLRPVRPGDTLSAVVEVIDKQPSRTRDDRGRVRFAYTTLNQHGEPVFSMRLDHIIARRSPAAIEV
jgi:acyl dehydratase